MSKLEFGYYYLFTATFFTAVFYAFTQHLFHGIGGKLGTLAFMGVMYSYIILNFSCNAAYSSYPYRYIRQLAYLLSEPLSETRGCKIFQSLALIIGGIYQINESFLHYDLPRDIPFLVIGSTFIGMITSRKHYKNFNLFIAPIVFTIIYYNISKEFNGFGGALGTAACISLLISIYLRSLKQPRK